MKKILSITNNSRKAHPWQFFIVLLWLFFFVTFLVDGRQPYLITFTLENGIEDSYENRLAMDTYIWLIGLMLFHLGLFALINKYIRKTFVNLLLCFIATLPFANWGIMIGRINEKMAIVGMWFVVFIIALAFRLIYLFVSKSYFTLKKQ